jgi:hypothetical protein
MRVLGSALLGIVITLLALTVAILYIVIIVVVLGRLATMIEGLLKKTGKRKGSYSVKADSRAHASQTSEPQKRPNAAPMS